MALRDSIYGVLLTLLLTFLLMAADGHTAPLEIEDMEGRTVSLDDTPQRIVALAPHIVENLYAIGAGPQLVGAVDYSDYPSQARALPRVGGVGGISIEAVTALQPDVVILWGSGTPRGLRSALDRAAIPYLVDEVQSLRDLGESFRRLGVLTGMEANAQAAVRRIQTYSSPAPTSTGSEPVRVFMQIWDRPLQSIGGRHILTEVIEQCGGESITADALELAPRISLERVLADDPELIIVENREQASLWQRWPTMTAMRAGQIVVIDPDLLHRPTLRLLDGMAAICEHIAKLKG